MRLHLVLLAGFGLQLAQGVALSAPTLRTPTRAPLRRARAVALQLPSEEVETASVAPSPAAEELPLADPAASEAFKKRLLERAPPGMSTVWRRADFWVNETATLLEVVNVLGRFDSCSEWTTRTEFTVWEDERAEDPRQAETFKRHEMAKRMGCAERVALYQNAPKLPFKNEALAASVGLTVEDFQGLEVTKAACNILYDALAESRSGLIPYATIDSRVGKMINPDGTFNELAFRFGHSKSTILIIVGWFIFGKANFIWILVGAKVLHDWRPDIIPSPVDLGLFKIWGII
ncbi:hypothetical protein AB1Y20_009703 [Prymnesium parvum]|uniref:PSI-F n=1 Tax=Prymnesium parvum TaxID=97485 RepID=A0AB34K2W1_PRYPA